jgi:predicted anti-sigma-YlaC factor YlaD
MACDKYKMLLSVYLDGETDRGESIEVASHLSVCQSCTIELHKLHRLKELFQRLEVKEPVRGFQDRLSTRLEITQRKLSFWQRLKILPLGRVPQFAYAFFSLALIVGSSFVFLRYSLQDVSVKESLMTEAPRVAQLPSEEIYAEDILFEPARGLEEREDILSFSVDTAPFEDLFDGLDSEG